MVPFPLLSREDKKLITRTQLETKLDLGWVTIITTTQSISSLFLVFVCGPHEFFIESLAGVCPLSPKDCRTFVTAFFGVFHLTFEVFTLTALKSYRLLWGENWLCVWGRACSNYVRPAMAHLVRVYWLCNCGFISRFSVYERVGISLQNVPSFYCSLNCDILILFCTFKIMFPVFSL